LAGGFRDGWIMHMHRGFRARFCDIMDAVPAHLVTVVRDPYDVFVSYYYWSQQRMPNDQERGERRPRHRMVGKPLDDPEVLAFLADPKGFGNRITEANAWLHSGRAIVVRYEDLHRDTVEALTRVTNQIEPIEAARIERAVEACNIDNMRKISKRMSQHVRAAKVGDSRDKLGESHLKIFREKYGELLTSLGYEVR
jgi:hypothetical protein